MIDEPTAMEIALPETGTAKLTRARIVAEAYSWLRTPYHHQAHIKGVGVDCVWLLIEVFRSVGIVAADFDPGNYAGEWYFHQTEEIYLTGVIEHAKRIETPQPGDVALYKFGHCVSHGAIIVSDTLAIHANRIARNVELIEMRSLADRFHSYWSAVT